MPKRHKKMKVTKRMAEEAEELKMLGNICYSNGDYPTAASLYAQGLEFDPNHPYLHCNLAQVLIHLQHYTPAKFHASRSIQLNPTFYKGYLRYAKATYEEGNLFLALDILNKGLNTCEDKGAIQNLFNAYRREYEKTVFGEQLMDCKNKNASGNENISEVKNENKNSKSKDKDSKADCSKSTMETKSGSDSNKKDLTTASDDGKNSFVQSTSKKDVAVKTSSTKKTATVKAQNKKEDNVKGKRKPIEIEDIKQDKILAMAEQISSKKHSYQRAQLEESFKEGYSASCKKLCRRAIDCYKEALKIIAIISLKDLGLTEIQVAVVNYVYNMMRIESNNYEKIVQAIQDINTFEHCYFVIPSFLYLTAKAYFKLNRFKTAIEPLEKCQDLLAKQIKFPSHCWPGTDDVIKETTRKGLAAALSDLVQLCKVVIPPTAICRFSKCLETSTHIVPSEHIFIGDPDFGGYITVICEEKCYIQYHVHCWKVFKETLSNCEKVIDKDILGRPCPTTDCVNSTGQHSSIVMIEIIDLDGNVKTQLKADTTVGTAQPLSKNKRKKASKSAEDKERAREKKPKRTTSSSSNKKIKTDKKIKKSETTKTRTAINDPSFADTERDFDEGMEKLVDIRGINFGCTSENHFDPQAEHYGRTDERINKEQFLTNEDALDDSEASVYKEFIKSYFYELLSTDGPQKVEDVQEIWENDEGVFVDVKPVIHVSNICSLLLESRIFCVIDDNTCISERLPETYAEAKTELVESVSFMIDGSILQQQCSTIKLCNVDKFEIGMVDNVTDDDDDDDDDDDERDDDDWEDYDSGTTNSSDDEGESSSTEDEDEEDIDSYEDEEKEEPLQAIAKIDRDQEHEATISSRYRLITQTNNESSEESESSENSEDELSKSSKILTGKELKADRVITDSPVNSTLKAVRESSTQTDDDNSMEEKLDGHRKKISSLNEDVLVKNEEIRDLVEQTAQLTIELQKLEGEKQKWVEQKEKNKKVNKKFVDQIAKKEATFQKEREQLLEEKKTAESKFENLKVQLEQFFEHMKTEKAEQLKTKADLENTVRELYKDKKSVQQAQLKAQLDYCNQMCKMYLKNYNEKVAVLGLVLKVAGLSCHDDVASSFRKWEKFKAKTEDTKNKVQVLFDKFHDMIQKGVATDFNDLLTCHMAYLKEPVSLPIVNIISELLTLSNQPMPERYPNESSGYADIDGFVIDGNSVLDDVSSLRSYNSRLMEDEESDISDISRPNSTNTNDHLMSKREFIKPKNNENESNKSNAKTKKKDAKNNNTNKVETEKASKKSKKKGKKTEASTTVKPETITSSQLANPTNPTLYHTYIPPANTSDISFGFDINQALPISVDDMVEFGNRSDFYRSDIRPDLECCNVEINVPDESGEWQVCTNSRSKEHSISVPVLLGSTKMKSHYAKLMERLQKRFPNKTEKELTESVKIVRERNNNSLTGLALDEIEFRVENVFAEKSKKPTSMGLEKFGETVWGHGMMTEVHWQGGSGMEECIICYEELGYKALTTLECNHPFHTECIRHWLREKSVCPLCNLYTKMPDEFPAL